MIQAFALFSLDVEHKEADGSDAVKTEVSPLLLRLLVPRLSGLQLHLRGRTSFLSACCQDRTEGKGTFLDWKTEMM